MPLQEDHSLLPETNRLLVRQDDREMAPLRERRGESLERTSIQSVDRLPSSRRGPAIGRVRCNPIDSPGSKGRGARIPHEEVRIEREVPEGLAASSDHPGHPIRPHRPEAERRRLEEDPSRTAKGIEERPPHRHPCQIHEGSGELWVEGDRKGERSPRDLLGLEPGPVHAMEDRKSVV